MIDNIEKDARRGLEVKRYHTWKTIQVQSVGEHTAQAMRILLAIWPTVPREVLVHALFHDIGEMAGDMPWPGKRNDPVLRARMEAAEEAVRSSMVERWSVSVLERSLTIGERCVFKLAESIEMWEFALTEMNMGNGYASVIAQRMLGEIEEYINQLTDYGSVVDRARDYIRLRQRQEEM